VITADNLYRDTFGILKLKPADGGDEVAVRPMRAFPLSDAEHFVALLDGDGNEVALIADMGELPAQPRTLLLQELEKSYFLPELIRVHEITDEFGIQRWEVETDRGPRVFEVRSREDLRWLHPGHLIVRDVDGNRYEIKRFDDLDSVSRLKIEGYL
jgi:catechol 2,3-dioxygenase-like lactoylglutathione lyase family enzyme